MPRACLRSNGKPAIPTFLVVLIGALVYANAFSGVFVFDDIGNIVNNRRIRTLWPPWQAMGHTDRPLLNLTYALNYAVSGLETWSYHLVNIIIHLFNGVLIHGIAYRLIVRHRIVCHAAEGAWLASVIAVLWIVHPLGTTAVPYISQRSELLVVSSYLSAIALYLRAIDGPRARMCLCLSVLCCFAGAGVKQVIATAPLLILLYDAMFVGGSVLSALRQRTVYYTGLAGTWLVLAFNWFVLMPEVVLPTLGFGVDITAWEYLRSQPSVLLYYLSTVAYPMTLCADYRWPVAQDSAVYVSMGVAVLVSFCVAAWACWHRRLHGFIAMALFFVLAPTSSIVPIADLAFAHRMYLPLFCIMFLITVAVHKIVSSHAIALRAACACVACIVLLLSQLSYQRNAVYHSRVAFWEDVVRKRPHNTRGRVNYASALATVGRHVAAKRHYQSAIADDPSYYHARLSYGQFLVTQGEYDSALVELDVAASLLPAHGAVHHARGMALLGLQRLSDAEEAFGFALNLDPGHAQASVNLAMLLIKRKQYERSESYLLIALSAEPELMEAHYGLGVVSYARQHLAQAISHFESALELDPSNVDTLNSLGSSYAQLGEVDIARAYYNQVLDIEPQHRSAQDNLDKLSLLAGHGGSD